MAISKVKKHSKNYWSDSTYVRILVFLEYTVAFQHNDSVCVHTFNMP